MKTLTFEEALAIARSKTKGFDYCDETERAYIFYKRYGENEMPPIGGNLPIVITKKGEALNYSGYLLMISGIDDKDIRSIKI